MGLEDAGYVVAAQVVDVGFGDVEFGDARGARGDCAKTVSRARGTRGAVERFFGENGEDFITQ